MTPQQKVVVVGGGPVGALTALYVATRGYKVELFDLRDDPNFGDPSARPAISLIPLALSERGIRALDSAGLPGLVDLILDQAKNIHSRRVYVLDDDGNQTQVVVLYGPNGEVIHNLPREKIAKRLLLALQNHPNATITFNHKLVSCNFESKVASFEPVCWKEKRNEVEVKPTENAAGAQIQNPPLDTTRTKAVHFDFIFGCDGAHSSLRQFMMRQSDMDFEQSYINASWCDFVISPDSKGEPRLNPENLHIWPDSEGLVVVQPDFDGSFRGGLIAPTKNYDELTKNPEKVEGFFREKYPGIVPDLISAKSAIEQFVNNQHISLKSIKCGKFGYGDSAVLLGDASHTMTPFHAMGMITGLEDVRIFFEDFLDPAHRQLRATNGNVSSSSSSSSSSDDDDHHDHHQQLFCPLGVVQRYTEHRRPDVQAMTDMAAEHYHELRFGVKSRAGRMKKLIEGTLQKYFPALGWASLYSRIQFGHERFTIIRQKERQQKKIIRSFVTSFYFTGGVLATALGWFAMVNGGGGGHGRMGLVLARS